MFTAFLKSSKFCLSSKICGHGWFKSIAVCLFSVLFWPWVGWAHHAQMCTLTVAVPLWSPFWSATTCGRVDENSDGRVEQQGGDWAGRVEQNSSGWVEDGGKLQGTLFFLVSWYLPETEWPHTVLETGWCGAVHQEASVLGVGCKKETADGWIGLDLWHFWSTRPPVSWWTQHHFWC